MGLPPRACVSLSITPRPRCAPRPARPCSRAAHPTAPASRAGSPKDREDEFPVSKAAGSKLFHCFSDLNCNRQQSAIEDAAIAWLSERDDGFTAERAGVRRLVQGRFAPRRRCGAEGKDAQAARRSARVSSGAEWPLWPQFLEAADQMENPFEVPVYALRNNGESKTLPLRKGARCKAASHHLRTRWGFLSPGNFRRR